MAALDMDLQSNWHVGKALHQGEASQEQQQRELHGPLTWNEVVAQGSLTTASFLLWHPSFPNNEWKPFEEVSTALMVQEDNIPKRAS